MRRNWWGLATVLGMTTDKIRFHDGEEVPTLSKSISNRPHSGQEGRVERKEEKRFEIRVRAPLLLCS